MPCRSFDTSGWMGSWIKPNRCSPGHVEAQCAVPAGRAPRILFRLHDAFGTSRYLPVLVYPKGAPDKATYVGHGMEATKPGEAAVGARDDQGCDLD